MQEADAFWEKGRSENTSAIEQKQGRQQGEEGATSEELTKRA